MSDWLDDDKPVKFSDKRDAERAVEEIRHAVKQIKDAGNLDADKVETLSTKLAETQRQLSELSTRDVGHVGGSDKELKRYVREDGSVRLRSASEKREWGGRTVEVTSPGLLDDSERTEAQDELQRAIGKRNLVRMLCRDGSPTPVCDAEVYRAAERLGDRRITDAVGRALYDTSNSGGELIDDGFMPDLFRSFETPRGLAAVFPTIQVSSETWKRPKVTQGARPYIKGQLVSDNPAAYTPSTPTTNESTMSIVGLAARTLVGDELAEDSAIPIVPFVQDELRRAIDDGREDAMINGDTTASHQDAIASWNIRSRWGSSGLGSSADHRRVFLGLRARAYDASNATDQSSAMTAAGFLSAMSNLGERAVNDLVCIMNPEYLVQKVMDFDEVQTLDKFGAGASILNGAIASIFGVPIVLSRFMSADLATSGLYTGSGAKTGFLLVDRAAYARYVKRGTTFELVKEIKSGHWEFVATSRELFDSPEAASTANVHYSYNLL